MTKYIFVTGGVVSSLGKGICAATIGRLLKNRGYKVFNQKFDPYLNVNPSRMSPTQHGEVYVTQDGAETDLDLGHYERFVNVDLNRTSSITSGKIYQNILSKERSGGFGGGTVQVIPHFTNELKDQIKLAAKTSGADFVITEIGGTVGDIESLPFIEAIRQWRADVGYDNVMYIHATLVPFLEASGEIKTKPTQHSVEKLRSLGIQPDMLILRSHVDIDTNTKDKVSMFCGVNKENVVLAKDVEVIFDIVPSFYNQGVDKIILNRFKMKSKKDEGVGKWKDLVTSIKNLKKEVNIGLVGKYVELHDAYLSVKEALLNGGYMNDVKVNITYISSYDVTDKNREKYLKNLDGIIIPDGEGESGTDGIITTLEYARKNNIPCLALAFGMELMAIEFARNVLKIKDATSEEFNRNSNNNIVVKLDKYIDVENDENLRLGLYQMNLSKGSKIHSMYKKSKVSERHRNGYEINLDYVDEFKKNGLIVSGVESENNLVEVIELKKNNFYIGVMYHAEFTSRILHKHPIFYSFVKAVKGKK